MKFEIRWCASTIDSVEKSHSVGWIGLEKFMWAAISRNNVGNPDLIPSWYIDCFLSRSPHVRLNDNIDCTDSSVHYARRRLPVAISYRISRISSPCFFSFSLYFFFSRYFFLAIPVFCLNLLVARIRRVYKAYIQFIICCNIS